MEDIVLEKILELNALFVQCCICMKMKVQITCDACNLPCCLLCVNTSMLIMKSTTSESHEVNTGIILKRCPDCHKNSLLCKNVQKTPKKECVIQ